MSDREVPSDIQAQVRAAMSALGAAIRLGAHVLVVVKAVCGVGQVQSMATLAGIEFSSATNTLERSGSRWVRRYQLTGHSYGLHFRTTFHASEDSFHILDLAIAISPEARSELASFVETYGDARRA